MKQPFAIKVVSARTAPGLRVIGGFTLIEVLLTLALIAALSAMAIPLVGRSFVNQRLRLGAEQFRTDICAARSKAIRTGVPYLVRYVPQASTYRIEPHQQGAPRDATGSTAVATAGGFGTSAAEGDVTSADLVIVERTLPQGVRFEAGAAILDNRELESLGALEQIEREQRSGQPTGEVIFCYPDGETTTVRVALGNDQNKGVQLDVRGLTGVVKISDVGYLSP